MVNGNKLLNPKDYYDIKDMWLRLQDDKENIYYVALVLKEKAKILRISINNINRDQVKKILQKYNGSGGKASIYGEQAIEYYDIFEKYK